MRGSTTSSMAPEEGATVVITHRVRVDRHTEYEEWMNEIVPLSKASPGHLDWHIIRPIPGLTETYTIIMRFDTRAHVREWIESPARARLIEKVRPLLVTGDDFYISSGLDFWFTPSGANAKVPVRWKQYLVTWSAIYPLVLTVPPAIVPMLEAAGLPTHRLFTTLVVTGAIVALMVYAIMPHYTRLLQRWLFH